MLWTGCDILYNNATCMVFCDMWCQPVYVLAVHPCENYTFIEAIGIQCVVPLAAKLMSPKDQMEFCQYDHFELFLSFQKHLLVKIRIRYSSHSSTKMNISFKSNTLKFEKKTISIIFAKTCSCKN